MSKNLYDPQDHSDPVVYLTVGETTYTYHYSRQCHHLNKGCDIIAVPESEVSDNRSLCGICGSWKLCLDCGAAITKTELENTGGCENCLKNVITLSRESE